LLTMLCLPHQPEDRSTGLKIWYDYPWFIRWKEGEEGVVKVIKKARKRLALAILLLLLTVWGACAPQSNSPATGGENHPPLIESLSASPSVIGQAQTTVIECVASDPDGDALSYQWSAEQGHISGQGPSVTWTSPDACADYIVTVTVTDSKGAKTSQSVTITVKKPG
jgi:hypothetical protein